jgi:hypothetical protein
MKKMNYQSPEMEIIKLKAQASILANSDEQPEWNNEPADE